QYGTVKRGRLGVMGQNLTNDLAKAMDLDVTQGVLITKVVDGSPAANAGIEPRDVITQVNDDKIKNFSELANAIGLRAPGTTVNITLIRDGEQQTVEATLAAQTEKEITAGSNKNLFDGLAGARFGPIPSDHPLAGEVEGIAVLAIKPGSPAARSGLRPGDVITAVNRQPVTSVEEFEKLADGDAKQLLLYIRRGDGALFLLIN
ncbi:MAG: PDZ domain-containing protein, partial [Salinisphaera sp.]|nr:PDZ domain-containing protein [Salinisphaera sp.]